MKIYLIRHGQSRWQVNRKDSDWDSPLTEIGHAQAESLSRWLAGRPVLDSDNQLDFAALHVSPHLRAQQTAKPIAPLLELEISTNDALREATFLVSEHLPSATSPRQASPPFAPSEVYATFKEQAREALSGLLESAEKQGGAVMAISHGGLISTMLRLVTGSDIISFWIYNASLNLIEWKRGRWHLVYLNLWDHLPPELRTF